MEHPKHKDYLEKTFLEELSHKLWSTKGARFYAHKRLSKVTDLSTISLSFLTAYLIILGLLSVYQVAKPSIISDNAVAFGSTALSILLLVFSQSEAAKEYKVKSLQFHDCALKIAALYNDLKIYQTLGERTPEITADVCRDISSKYQSILDKYPNHESIDFSIHKAENKAFYNLSEWDVLSVRIKYYLKTKFRYHFLIIGTPLIFIVVVYLKMRWNQGQ